MPSELHRFDCTFTFKDQSFDALIFDCDGTLTDSMPLHYQAWHSTMSKYGIEFDEERFYAMGGIPSDRIVHILADEQQIVLDAIAVAEEKEHAFLQLMDQLKPIDRVCEVARRNFGKRPISVASGGMGDVVRQQLTHIQMIDLFSIRVCSEDTQRHKPEPDVFLEAAQRMNVPAERCCVFEDSPLGFEAAARAKMAFVDIRKWR